MHFGWSWSSSSRVVGVHHHQNCLCGQSRLTASALIAALPHIHHQSTLESWQLMIRVFLPVLFQVIVMKFLTIHPITYITLSVLSTLLQSASIKYQSSSDSNLSWWVSYLPAWTRYSIEVPQCSRAYAQTRYLSNRVFTSSIRSISSYTSLYAIKTNGVGRWIREL